MNQPIILKLEGGLGNQLFEFAAGYYLAGKFDTDLILDQFGIPLTNHMREKGLGFGEYEWPKINGHNNILTLPEVMGPKLVKLAQTSQILQRGILKYRMHKSNLFHLPIYKETESDSDFFKINQPVKLHGNFQSWSIVEEATKFGFPRTFMLKSQSKWVKEFIKNIDQKNSVAVHFRLGKDSVDNIAFSQPNTNYYLKALELLNFDANSKDVYVFSDEIDLARERFSSIFGNKCNFVDPPLSESPAQKQYLLSQFGSIVCANSTFCSWAGWSISNSGGRVIVPIPFSDTSKKGSRDFPDNWTLLSKSSGRQLPDYAS
jgi:hypothetical protein